MEAPGKLDLVTLDLRAPKQGLRRCTGEKLAAKRTQRLSEGNS